MMLCSKIVISIFTSFIIIIVNQKKLNVLSQSGEVGREIVYNIKLRPRPRITIVGQGPTAPAAGAGGCCLVIFLSSIISSPWRAAQYRLKYCSKGQLNPKQPNNHHDVKLPSLKCDLNFQEWL